MSKTLDLRVQKTYRALHNAFTELLAEQHFEDVTLNELCKRAMIRRTTFYKHFADKYEYFTFYLQEVCEEFQKTVALEVAPDDFVSYSTKMTGLLLEFLRQHEAFAKNIMESNMFPLLLNILQNFIMEEILKMLRSYREFQHISLSQLEGTAAFFSGGLLNTLFLSMRKGTLPTDEEFLEIVAPFIRIYK